MKAILFEKYVDFRKNSIWSNKNFFLLWLGMALSNFSFHIFTLALPIIIYDLTHSTLAMSTMRAIEIIPNILLGMLIGVIIDRVNRKKVMLGSIGIQILMIFSIVLLLNKSTIELWHLYIIGFLLYSSGYTFGTAYHTALPLIINKEQLMSANAAKSFIDTLINIVGPAFAGFALISMGYNFGLVITVIGLTILLILTSLILIPENIKNEKRSNHILKDMKEGWDQLVSSKELWIATVMILFVNSAIASSGAVLVFFALDILDVSETNLGFIFSSAAIGGIMATFLVKRSRKWEGRGKMFLGAISIAALGQFVLFLSNEWFWMALGMLFMGLCTTFINIHYFTLRQESTPNHLLGRVAGTSSMLMKLSMPISYIVVGALGEFISIKYVFLYSSLILLSVAIYGTRTSITKLQ